MHDVGVAFVNGTRSVDPGQARLCLHEQVPFGVGHSIDDIRLDSIATIGKDREAFQHLPRSDGAGTQGRRQERRMVFGVKAKTRQIFLDIEGIDGLHYANRYQVLRFLQCRSQRHRTVKTAVIVTRFPKLAAR